MNVDTQKSLAVRHITPDDLQNTMISDAIEQAKILYGNDILYVLVSTVEVKEEMAFRPEMGKFMSDTSIQIMKISDLEAMKDTFNCHNTIAMGNTTSKREPSSKSFYNVVIGNILAINPDQESLEKFLTQE